MNELRYCESWGSASFFLSLPSSPSFSYGNPSSSSELLGSSINQRLYEIPAGAKGQRRKLAAVFSSPFMLAAGLIAKCAISLISTLKQTPRQAGEELFARSYILWHRILFWGEGGGGGGWVVGGRVVVVVVWGEDLFSCFSVTPLLLHPFSLLPPIPSSSGVGGQTVEHAPLTLLCWHISAVLEERWWLAASPSAPLRGGATH